ncbi:B-cell lymphoma 3 protein isoform X2 [Tamandua tetradactyla]|uniref:B-cell lymphoma 3 protein isoform X2 n=1 Tax=Tamandua tetradactyla TaxID=48850 RepID=UPI004053C2D0
MSGDDAWCMVQGRKLGRGKGSEPLSGFFSTGSHVRGEGSRHRQQQGHRPWGQACLIFLRARVRSGKEMRSRGLEWGDKITRALWPAGGSEQRPLHIAVVQGNLPAVHRLVNLFQQGGRELDTYNNLRQTPLHLAVITTLPSVVRLLVTAGASPMALDRHGQTAAHLACEHRSPTCLRALLDSAAPGTVDLEARNYDGEARRGRQVGLSGLPPTAEAPGPNLTAPPPSVGLTALHVAVNTECQEAVLLLLERGADVDSVDIKSGRSPLIHAVENNSLSMVQLLLQHGANVNAQMYSGSSALHSASGRGLLPLVRTLVRSGADSGLKNCHNDTPLMVARSRRVIDILRGKATRPAPTPKPEPSSDRSASTSPESNSRLSSNGLLSASPSSSPSQSPPRDPPGFPMAPHNFFLPPSSPPAFLPFAGVLRAPGRPVPPSPAPGGS